MVYLFSSQCLKSEYILTNSSITKRLGTKDSNNPRLEVFWFWTFRSCLVASTENIKEFLSSDHKRWQISKRKLPKLLRLDWNNLLSNLPDLESKGLNEPQVHSLTLYTLRFQLFMMDETDSATVPTLCSWTSIFMSWNSCCNVKMEEQYLIEIGLGTSPREKKHPNLSEAHEATRTVATKFECMSLQIPRVWWIQGVYSASNWRYTNDNLSRVSVLAQVVSRHQPTTEGGQTEAGPRPWPELGGMQGPAGPKGSQRQPKRPGAQRGVRSAGLLHVFGLVITLNIPMEVYCSPAHEDVIHCCPLMDYQTCYNDSRGGQWDIW